MSTARPTSPAEREMRASVSSAGVFSSSTLALRAVISRRWYQSSAADTAEVAKQARATNTSTIWGTSSGQW